MNVEIDDEVIIEVLKAQGARTAYFNGHSDPEAKHLEWDRSRGQLGHVPNWYRYLTDEAKDLLMKVGWRLENETREVGSSEARSSDRDMAEEEDSDRRRGDPRHQEHG